jgi:hypothetical protein
VVWTGETYDFEYDAQETGGLRLEVENTPTANARWKIVEPIVVQ